MMWVKDVIRAVKPLYDENICYGVFRVTPVKKLLRLCFVSKMKQVAIDECDYLTKLNKHKYHFEVKKMSYLLSPDNFIILE